MADETWEYCLRIAAKNDAVDLRALEAALHIRDYRPPTDREAYERVQYVVQLPDETWVRVKCVRSEEDHSRFWKSPDNPDLAIKIYANLLTKPYTLGFGVDPETVLDYIFFTFRKTPQVRLFPYRLFREQTLENWEKWRDSKQGRYREVASYNPYTKSGTLWLPASIMEKAIAGIPA